MNAKLKFAVVIFLIPGIAMANPSVRPSHVLGAIVVVGTSFLLEVAITTWYLAALGMSAGVVFVTLLIVNVGTYAGILLPTLDSGLHIALVEGLVVFSEALVLKFMSCFSFFQGDTFTVLNWRHAFGAAAFGNAFSYWIGNMLS